MSLITRTWAACALAMVACTGGTSGVGGTDGGADAGKGHGDAGVKPVTAVADLGHDCSAGCDLTICALPNQDCSSGTCLWDGRQGFDAYCTQSCGDAGCPAGWDCLSTSDGRGRFCAARTPVCGDGVVERGELCDPGPTVGDPASGCAIDCAHLLGGGSVRFSMNGQPVTLAGATDGVIATAESTTMAVSIWAGQDPNPQVSFRIPQASLAGPLPRTVPTRFDLVMGDLCYEGAAGGMVVVDGWDGQRHLTGSFDQTLTYQRCCSTCQDPTTTSLTITASHFDLFTLPDNAP